MKLSEFTEKDQEKSEEDNSIILEKLVSIIMDTEIDSLYAETRSDEIVIYLSDNLPPYDRWITLFHNPFAKELKVTKANGSFFISIDKDGADSINYIFNKIKASQYARSKKEFICEHPKGEAK